MNKKYFIFISLLTISNLQLCSFTWSSTESIPAAHKIAIVVNTLQSKEALQEISSNSISTIVEQLSASKKPDGLIYAYANGITGTIITAWYDKKSMYNFAKTPEHQAAKKAFSTTSGLKLTIHPDVEFCELQKIVNSYLH